MQQTITSRPPAATTTHSTTAPVFVARHVAVLLALPLPPCTYPRTHPQALNLRGCSRVSGACLQHLSSLTGVTDLCLLHNPKLAVDDACVASVAKLPNLKILGLGNYQAGVGVVLGCVCTVVGCSWLRGGMCAVFDVMCWALRRAWCVWYRGVHEPSAAIVLLLMLAKWLLQAAFIGALLALVDCGFVVCCVSISCFCCFSALCSNPHLTITTTTNRCTTRSATPAWSP